MPATQTLGIHFYFTAGNTKPATSPAWIKRGIVDTLALKPTRDKIEQEGPLPGRMGRVDVIEAGRKMDFTVKMKQPDPLFWQLVFSSLALATGNVQFNPLEGGLVKGWAKFQGYDQNDVLVVNVEVFCAIEMPAGTTVGGKQLVSGDIEGMVIENPLNTGSLNNLA
jgi:hypothetical protein